jgi:hypothetical protein
MRISETRSVEEEVIGGYTCDRCGMTAKYEDDTILEAQEFLHWNHVGGYGSVFGDGDVLELDLCQKCVEELLGDFIRTVGNTW